MMLRKKWRVSMKKILSLLLMCVLCLNMATGCGKTESDITDGSGIKIYLTISKFDTFKSLLVDAAKEEAEKLGAQIVIEDAEGVLETQASQIKQAASEGYDVILCNPVNPDTALELEELANGVPIVFYNSCPDEKRLKADKYIYVGSNEADAGRYQAEYILENSQGKDEINVVILKGEASHSATKGRTASLISELYKSEKTVNIVFKDTADWDQEKAKDLFNIFLTTGQPYDFVASNNDSMALGVLDSYAENNIDSSKVPVLGIDATKEGCAAVKEGRLAFTVYQSAKGQGECTIKAAIALARGESISGIEGVTEDNKYIYVPFEKVTADNVSNYN